MKIIDKFRNQTTDHIQTLENQPTAVYNALHSHDGQLVAAVADMNIFDHMDPEHVKHLFTYQVMIALNNMLMK